MNIYSSGKRGFTPHHFLQKVNAVRETALVCLYRTKQHQRLSKSGAGFTLIELLVVMAIIGILASIVLASMSEYREKSRNSARNASVEEYIKALELMRTNTGLYVGNSATFQCLGDYEDDLCWTGGTGYGESAALQTALSAYMQPFASDWVDNFEGFVYRPCPATATGCAAGIEGEAYEIRWFLEGTDRTCVRNQAPINTNYNNLGITYCRYLHQ